MTVGVLEANGELEFVADLDAVNVDILDALAQPAGQVEGPGDEPALLASVLNGVVPARLPVSLNVPALNLTLNLVLAHAVAREALDARLADLEKADGNLAKLEALEQRGETHLEVDATAKGNSLLRDDNGVVNLVGPDVLHAHSVVELEGTGLKSADDAQVLIRVQVVGELAATDGGLEAIGDGGLGDALDALSGVAGHGVLEGILVVAGLQRHALAGCADKWVPAVLEDGDEAIDLLTRGSGSSLVVVSMSVSSQSRTAPSAQRIVYRVGGGTHFMRRVPVRRRWTSSSLRDEGRQRTMTPLTS